MSPSTTLAASASVKALRRPEPSILRQTVAALRQSIINLELKPGQRLVEREFVERFGVSRATFREALRELAAEGLVSVVPQKGARVASPSPDEAIDLYEVRTALESILVTRFVERATDGEVRALKATVEAYSRVAYRTTDIIQLLRSKEDFYQVLIAGARSTAVQQLLEAIKARVQTLRATSLSTPGRAFETVAELEAMVQAIIDRDATRAARLCAEHVRNACRAAQLGLAEARK